MEPAEPPLQCFEVLAIFRFSHTMLCQSYQLVNLSTIHQQNLTQLNLGSISADVCSILHYNRNQHQVMLDGHSCMKVRLQLIAQILKTLYFYDFSCLIN
jgi:hypothetical protein